MKLVHKYQQTVAMGRIDRAFVRGISRALNTNFRRENGYSVSDTASKISGNELEDVLALIRKFPPLVSDQLRDQGLTWLRSRAIQRKLDDREKAIVADFDHYTLQNFVDGRGNGFFLPVWRVHAAKHYLDPNDPRLGKVFDYYVGSWQSGLPLTILD